LRRGDEAIRLAFDLLSVPRPVRQTLMTVCDALSGNLERDGGKMSVVRCRTGNVTPNVTSKCHADRTDEWRRIAQAPTQRAALGIKHEMEKSCPFFKQKCRWELKSQKKFRRFNILS